ncbi:hypothetical protein AWW67_12600 [Roseivirga seohaensis]|uniref:Uncharacterized protein n=2 Tax=Roseivirga seohaensis TaxID=1914963 RepID=A0A150XKM7_9BACT|nr:hypothetical protein AWW67_12600 [Roseivirga seohaensis]
MRNEPLVSSLLTIEYRNTCYMKSPILKALILSFSFITLLSTSLSEAQTLEPIFNPSMTPIAFGPSESALGEGIGNVIDGSKSNKFLTFEKSWGLNFYVDTEEISIVKSLTITTANDHPERDPKLIKIYGRNVPAGTNSTDTKPGWTLIDEVSFRCRDLNEERHADNTEDVDNDLAFNSYWIRLHNPCDASEANSVQISEVQLYGIFNQAPSIIFDETATGGAEVGKEITAIYEYSDPEDDPESGTTFQWYSDDVAIEGATSAKYTPTIADLGSELKVKIIPNDGTSFGSEVLSSLGTVNCKAGFTCDVQNVSVCDSDKYQVPGGDLVSINGTYEVTEGIVKTYYNVTFNRAEASANVFSDGLIAESGSVAYTAQTSVTGVLTFDKDQDYWVDMNALQDDLNGTSRSVFMWVKSEANVANDNQALFAINTGSGGNVAIFWIDNDGDNLELYDGNNARSASFNMSDQLWHYVGYTYDVNTNETVIYVDGIENQRFTNNQSTVADSKYSLGQEFDNANDTDHFNGDMAEISVWDEVLTAAEVREAMKAKINNGHPKFANLVGYYSIFGDCEDATDVLKDHSGKGNDGVMQNNFTVDFKNVQSVPGFNAIDWYEHISWKKDGAEVSTDPAYTFDVAAGSYELVATRNFVQSTDTWSMTVNGNATTVNQITDETLCLNGPVTRTVTTSQVNYLDFEETENNSIEVNGLADALAGKSRSVFMWLNKESNIGSGGFNEVLVFQDSDVDNLSRFYFRDTERLALWDGTNDRLNSSVLSNDTWYFVGYTYDNATGETKLYLNGNVEDSGTLNMPLGEGWFATLGAKYNDNGLEDYLDGKMAEITIWDKVLTQEEVTILMGAAPAHDATNLVAAYGTHKNIADNQLRDLTANGNNGLASHQTIIVNNLEEVIPDYDASAHYTFSWKKGGIEFDTDAIGNITVEEGTTAYSVTYGTPLFQKSDDFSLSYTNLIPTQPAGKIIAASTNVTFEVEEIPGASYQWYRREEGFDEVKIAGDLTIRDVYRGPDGTIYNATSTAGIYYTTDEGNTKVIRTTAHGLVVNDINEIRVFDNDIYVVQKNTAVSISKDGGNSFQTLFQRTSITSPIPNTVLKAEDGSIYIGALNGLLVSTDGGANFNNHTDVTGTVDVLYEVGETLYVGSREGLFISNDNGATFIQKTITDGLAFNSIRDVYKSGNTLYVSTQTADFKDGAISTSTDAGESFTKTITEANGFNGHLVNAIYEFAGDLFVGTSRGLFVSSDQGDTFSQFSSPDAFTKSVLSLSEYNGQLEVGTSEGLSTYRSNLKLEDETSGSTNLIEGAKTRKLTISKVALEQNGTVYFVEVTKGDCKQQSDDLLLTVVDVPGVTSISPANGTTDVAIDTELSIEFSKTVSKGSGGLKIFNYATDALVQTFTADDLTIDGTTVSITSGVSLDNSSQYYITLDADLVKDNSNAGNLAMTDKDAWSFYTICEPLVLTQPEDQSGFVSGSVTFSVPEVAGASYQWFKSQNKTEEIYDFSGLLITDINTNESTIHVTTGFERLFTSTDGGESFTENVNIAGRARKVVEFDGVLYVATFNMGLAISTDNGATFDYKNQANNGLADDNVNSIYVNNEAIYVSTDSGLSISTDNGESFVTKTTNDGLGSNTVEEVYAKGSTVYAANSNGGFSVSTDGGETFTSRIGGNSGLTSSISELAVASDGTIYAGGVSVFVSKDGGDSFTELPAAEQFLSSQVYDLDIEDDILYINVQEESLGAAVYSSADEGNTLTTLSQTDASGYRERTISVLNGQVFAGGYSGTLVKHSGVTSLKSGTDPQSDNYISGATTASLTISKLTEDLDQSEYFVVVTKGECEETSQIAKLTLGTPAPLVTNLFPADDELDVDISPEISITFDQAIVKGTGNIEVRRASDDELLVDVAVNSILVTVDDQTATIVLGDTNLELDTEYYITIPNTAFQNGSGIAFAGISDKNTWSFTTETEEVIPLIVAATSPSATRDAQIDFPFLNIQFNEQIAIGSGQVSIYRTSDNSLFETLDISTARIKNSGRPLQAQLELSQNWEAGVEYYIQYPQGLITSLDGAKVIQAIDDNTTLAFKAESFNENIITSFFPATGSNTYVADSEVDFKLFTSIGVGLERDPLGSFRIYKAANDELIKTIEYDGQNDRDLDYGDDENYIKFEFDDDELEPGTEYYVLIDDGFIVSYENALFHVGISDPTTWRFTTLAAPTTPTLIGIEPATSATGVAVNSNIVLTYSENIQSYLFGESGTATNNVVLYDANDNVIETLASDRLKYSGARILIKPTNDLEYNTSYYLLIDDEAFVSNNGVKTEAITDPTVISFTTASQPNTAPVASSVSIAGSLEANLELTGSYNYSDADTDAESGSALQWFVADDATGSNRTAISGATSSTFTLTSSEVGKYITFAVTPNDGTDAGTRVLAAYAGPVEAAVIPTLVSTSPVDGAIDILKDANLSLTLSEDVTAGIGNITLTPVNGTATVIDVTSAVVTILGTDVTINPASDLLEGEFYTVTFDATAFVDANGNNSTGLTNETTWNFTVKEANVAPVAQGVSIKKSLVVNGVLEGSYTYFDQNDDSESGTTFQWYRADDAVGTGKTAINGATSNLYTVTNDDNGKFVSFEVTPNDGTLSGTAEESTYFGPILINDGVTNIPPAFTSDALTSVLDNAAYSYTITYEDLNNDVPTLTKTTGPDWLSVNGFVLSGNPTSANIGNHSIVLTLDDGNGGTETQKFTVTVLASNTAPIVKSVGVDVVTSPTIGAPLRGLYNFIDLESDPDNSNYKWYRYDDLSGSGKTEINGATSVNYTLIAADAGKYLSFEVTPNDGKVDGATVESTVLGPVDKKTPALSLSDITKTYGDADFILSANTNSSGAINYTFNNDQTGAAINGSTVTLGNAGEITVNVSLAEDAEYQSRQVQGTITIGKKAIELTATDASKSVGDTDPILNYTVTTGSIVGSDEVVTVSRDAGEAPGTYAINLTDGADADNYEITAVPGVFTISQRSLTITAEVATKTYGDADPTFNYSITEGALENGDELSGGITRVEGEDVGIYALQGSLFNPDYKITFVSADLTIGKATLTATADDKSKAYGEENPELTISYSGFANGDTKADITEPTASTVANASSPIGTYDITLSGGTATNYNINLVNGQLTVEQRPFITTWEITSNDVNRSRTFFNTLGSHTYLYDIDWGDGAVETDLTGAASHTYVAEGTYTVKISGQFPQFELSFSRLRSVEQWGDIEWKSMEGAFVAADFDINATDAPKLSQVTSMKRMFERTFIGKPDLTSWDVSKITNMSEMFKESDFNGDINGWDVSAVTDMSYMFAQTENFNSSISNWNTSAVQNMSYMFYYAQSFDQPIDAWDVSSATTMSSMFADAALFNQNLNSWDVSSVTKMDKMFDNALLFNGDITGWNVSSVTDMSNMFDDAKAFNQDINGWDVSNVTRMNAMFNDADAFNQDLNSWDVSKVETFQAMFQNNDTFNGNISNWDVSNATKLERMFEDAHAFNQDISNWQPTNAENLTAMFRDARSFNQDIGSWKFPNADRLNQMFYEAAAFDQDISSWETGNIVDMSSMFENAEAFNQNIGNWDVSSVTSFGSMFRGASMFNQDISEWDMSAATSMNSMFKNATVFNQDISGWVFADGLSSMSSVFENATAFNQNLSNWEITNIENLYAIFNNSGLSVANYDATLIGWAAQEVKNDVEFGVTGLQYCAGTEARQSLIDEHNWTIENDTQGCSATVTIPDVSANEDDGAITVTLTSDAFVIGGFTVDVSTSNGTAEAGTDYTAVTAETITFAGTVGETQSFTITPTTDIDVEVNETLTVSMDNLITGVNNRVTITDEATITILNDDVPVVSFNTTAQSNAESVTNSSIVVNLDQAGLSAATVDYTVTGTATGGGVDYTLANGSLSFAAGELSKTIDLTIVDDALIEENETVVIALSNVSGASLGVNTVFTYTIVNNDAKVTIENISQFEDGESFLVSATLEGTIEGGFTVDLSTTDGTATVADGDYTAVSGTTLTFIGTDGEVQKLDIAPGVDSKLEADETFTVSLSNLAGTTANVVITDQAVLTIKNDDTAAVTLADASGNEGDGAITVTATIDNAVQGGFTVEVNTVDGTATLANSDYTAVAGKTLTFAGIAGETQTFTVTPTNDLIIEANETLTVSMSRLSTVLGVDVSDEATVTIVNDDFNNFPTDITLSASSIAENNALDATVGSLSTTDADVTNTHTYALVSGAGDSDNASFTLAGSTLKTNNTSFNFEDKASYSVRIETNDGEGGTFAKAFEITVTNVNEAPFTLSLTNATIEEADEAQEVGQFISLDPDNGDSFSYSLIAGAGDADNAQFAISGNTLSSAGAIDFEGGASRSIRVQVADAGGLTFEQTFSITIEDVVAEPVREYTQNEPGADVKNVFSPNGDGVNETWVIEDLLDNPFNQVKIFAQGGKLIYSKVNYSNDWAGTFKDNPVPEGTYYYEILIYADALSTTPARTIKGFLTIIRNR